MKSQPGEPFLTIADQVVASGYKDNVNDYTIFFDNLQIDREWHQRVWKELQRYRNKKSTTFQARMKKGTEESIQLLARDFMKTIAFIVWKVDSEWLKDGLQEPALVYRKGGENLEIIECFVPLFWHMRSLLYKKKKVNLSTDARRGTTEAAILPDETPRGRTAAQSSTRKVLEKLISSVPEVNHAWTAKETSRALDDLIVRLSEIRVRSTPANFARSWKDHVGRLEECESLEQDESQAQEFPEAISPETTNVTNEPFSTMGLALQPIFPSTPLTPDQMSLYITVHPPRHPYSSRAYHWYDAPVRGWDQERFFQGLLDRLDIGVANQENGNESHNEFEDAMSIDQEVASATDDYANPAESEKLYTHIVGWVLSYGWNDSCRFVGAGRAERTAGFWMLQDDIKEAARKGVSVWRMKVLVLLHEGAK